MQSRFDPSGMSRVEIRPLSAREWCVVAIFGLAVLCYLLLIAGGLLRDPDSYWHIVVGRQIWESGEMPRHDALSHSHAGAPWIAKEWLSQLLLFGAHALAGWRGVVLLTTASAALALALLLAFLLRRLRPTVALALVLLVVPLAAGQFVARPHIFFFPLLVLWVGGLLDAVERERPPSAWLLLIVVLWANLHASFPIALVLAALFAAEAVLTAPVGGHGRLAMRWFLFGLGGLAAMVVTPYGFEPLLLSIVMFGTNDAVQFIQEWRPFRPEAMQWFAIVGLLGGFVAIAARRGNLLRLLPVIPCTWLMFRYVRFGGLFAVVSAMSVAGPLARSFPAIGLPPRDGSAKPRRITLAALLLLAGGAACLTVLNRVSPIAEITPAAALRAARDAGASGPVFNAHDFGGFLIWSGVPTFIDGRNDQLFIGGFAPTLYAAEANEDDAPFLALLDRYGITWALIRTGSAAAVKLDRAGWRRVHADAVAVVYLR